jgi:TRAP-type C4-dicarboxylate transport system permease small subunit
MVSLHVDNLNALVLDLIMFGFGFAAIWFGLTHFDIQRTENKIQKIHDKADRINRILHRK